MKTGYNSLISLLMMEHQALCLYKENGSFVANLSILSKVLVFKSIHSGVLSISLYIYPLLMPVLKFFMSFKKILKNKRKHHFSK